MRYDVQLKDDFDVQSHELFVQHGYTPVAYADTSQILLIEGPTLLQTRRGFLLPPQLECVVAAVLAGNEEVPVYSAREKLVMTPPLTTRE